MFDRLLIKNFRVFQELELAGLKRINIFVGANNSGKSSILEALYFHCSPLDFKSLLSLLSHRNGGIRMEPESLYNQFKYFFHNLNIQNNIDIEGTYNNIPRKVSLKLSPASEDNKILSSNNSELPLTYGYAALSYSKNKEKPKTIQVPFSKRALSEEPDNYEKSDIKRRIIDPHEHNDNYRGVREYNETVKSGFHENCTALLRSFDDNIKDVRILLDKDTPELFIDHSTMNMAPLSLLGDGYRRIFLTAVSLSYCFNGIILLDEFETGIHYKALRHFSQWLYQTAVEKNIQVFTTTHSLDVIDALLFSDKIDPEDIAVFKLIRSDKTVRTKCFSGTLLKESREELGADIR